MLPAPRRWLTGAATAAPREPHVSRMTVSSRPSRPGAEVARLDALLASALNFSGVSLRLGNGAGWHIVAAPGAQGLLKKLTYHMRLTAAPDGPDLRRLILTEEGPDGLAAQTSAHAVQDFAPRRVGPWTYCDAGSVRYYRRHGLPHVICRCQGFEEPKSESQILPRLLYPVYLRAVECGGAVLHAALLEKGGMGFVLAGRSGAGKSTCCSRIAPPWRPVCDDQTLVLPSAQGGYVAHPLPTWSACTGPGVGPTWEANRALPLSAIFLLEKASDDALLPVGRGEAAAILAGSADRVTRSALSGIARQARRHARNAIMDVASSLVARIPAFRLNVTREGRFWEVGIPHLRAALA